MSAVEIIKMFKAFLHILGRVTLYMYFFWSFYTLIGFFCTRKFPKAKKQHKYAILIAARNEETVIGNLIDSIKNQDYPSELVTIFVSADNCTDNTAKIAREHGAICYERHDPDHRTKGYALEFLVDNIGRDYGIESFEAYFIFDADNLLKKDYITRMNEAFDSGEKIVTSYRNTKNFSDNWIAASYGIHWLRTIRHEHRARSVLNLATRIQGTGFMFASEIIKNGWHYVSFTEDRAFSADAVVNGYRISYCDAAEFYDEQPTSLRIALRQRIRWGKGHLQAFVESGPKLLLHVFNPNGVKTADCPHSPEFKNISHIDSTVYNLRDDTGTVLMKLLYSPVKHKAALILWPFRIIAALFVAIAYAVGVVTCVLVDLAGVILCKIKKTKFFSGITENGFFKSLKMRYMSYDMFLITFPNNIVSLFRRWLNVFANIALKLIAAKWLSAFIDPLWAYFLTFASRWYGNMFFAIYVFIIERRRMIYIPIWKKVFYCITWPLFDIIGAVSVLIALFSHVEWKPIPHKADINIDMLSKELAGKK